MAAPRFNAARPGLASRINRPVPRSRMPLDNGFGSLGAGLQQAAKAAKSVYDDSMRSKLAHDAAAYATEVTKSITDIRTNPDLTSAEIQAHLEGGDGALAKRLDEDRAARLENYAADPEWRQRAEDMLEERYQSGLNALKGEVYRRGEREENERNAATMQMAVDSAEGLAFDGAPPKSSQEIAGELFPGMDGELSEAQRGALDRVLKDHVSEYVRAIGRMPAGERYDAYELAAEVHGDIARNAAGTERIESWKNAKVFESAKAVTATGLSESVNAGNSDLMGAIAGDEASETAVRLALAKGKDGAKKDGALAAFDDFLEVKRAEYAVASAQSLGTLMGSIADSQSLADAAQAFNTGKADMASMTPADRQTYLSRGKAALTAKATGDFARIFSEKHPDQSVVEEKVSGVMATLMEAGALEANETLALASAVWKATPADSRDPAELGALAQRYTDHGLEPPEDVQEAQRDFSVAVYRAAAKRLDGDARSYFVSLAGKIMSPGVDSLGPTPAEWKASLKGDLEMVNAVMTMVSEQARGASPYKSQADMDKDIALILEASTEWSEESGLRDEFLDPGTFMEAWFDWYATHDDVPSVDDLVDLREQLNVPPEPPSKEEQQWRAYLDKHGFR